MKKFPIMRIVLLLLIPIIAFFIVQNPFTTKYVKKLRSDVIDVSASKDSLYSEIEKKASEYEIPPQDAKIDKVWKKIPGYNGIAVNINASFENMRDDGVFVEEELVFEQIKPKVHLKDLPASPIFKGHPEKPMIAITFNVAWGNEYLSSILATLKKHSVYATFFIEGRWAKENPNFVRMIYEGGHEIGNHSYSHPDMKQLSAEKIKKQLHDTNEIIKATIGKTPTLFAPPSGSYNDQVVKIAHDMNMETIMWSIDTIDWKDPPPQTLIQRVTKQLHNGAIILAHPTESTSKALDTLLTKIKDEGYRLGTISNLLDEKRIMN
ncbi:polysaccharide deacetylase family protein [Caldibacillus thermolactis]|jgi:peptidoglycan-N-acetylglucosamine deacetylase|uniref:Polysaccharide deacetylase family protein n=1 Tax=Pallidibacillus thermolactis TaxID=251051 RepID=A0ABT2WBJ9_9BACI|nr:polysaccharide deacetylase family protein [Pallidibacillus thermolactis]MCU9593044.1 polysaccharide deacetylase family protein [Pallidibacillus thermolactis]MCU9600710.1 polysaccharide deacetylase family protein [Pallidibacillus thermolactis subsp. kokeshiiformis]MED1672054.1 polysaccharide deacetylase family protein [Pallidibacillus thermolactis subsp. kokeshiiformis]